MESCTVTGKNAAILPLNQPDGNDACLRLLTADNKTLMLLYFFKCTA